MMTMRSRLAVLLKRLEDKARTAGAVLAAKQERPSLATAHELVTIAQQIEEECQ